MPWRSCAPGAHQGARRSVEGLLPAGASPVSSPHVNGGSMPRNFKRLRSGTVWLVALVSSLLLAVGTASPVPAAETLTRISSDPYTNPTSNHKTQVEPDTFAFGTTVVSA